MNSHANLSPIPERNTVTVSLTTETNPSHQQKKEGLTTKLRQTFNAAGKRVQGTHRRKLSVPDLSKLTPQSQELILRAIETIKSEDSKNIMAILDESRDMLKNSYDEFKLEQNEYKQQLEKITQIKEAGIYRRKENAIPLSMFAREKRDPEGLADLRPNSGTNTTYQAYFEALLVTDQNQHPSDKAAVIKYIRRRERRRRAEENRKNRELTADIIEKQTAEIIENMDGMDIKFEHERERQNNLSRAKLNEKKIKTKASEIIDQAHEADLARQRVEQTQREKIEARLSAARRRTPVNTIHVQSRLNDDKDSQLNDEQKIETNNSIELLSSTTPSSTNDNIPKIHI